MGGSSHRTPLNTLNRNVDLAKKGDGTSSAREEVTKENSGCADEPVPSAAEKFKIEMKKFEKG